MAMKLLMKATVRSVTDVAESTRAYELTPAKRERFPPFEPGAHVTVQLPNGLKRQYSLCSDPGETRSYRIAVLCEEQGRGGSRFMHHHVRSGDTLYIRYPDNRFPIAPEALHHVLVAGGIGITPFIPMVAQLAGDQASFELHYCARSRARAAFVDELEQICPPGTLHLHFDGGEPSRGLDVRSILAEPRSGTHCYSCGPAALMDAVRAATSAWPDGRVHFEAFSGLRQTERVVGDAFRIRIASTGRLLEVPSNQSALEVLREAGFEVDSSCEAGACGSCRVHFVSGEPIHRDFALRPGERADQFICCVSRATGELTLDL